MGHDRDVVNGAKHLAAFYDHGVETLAALEEPFRKMAEKFLEVSRRTTVVFTPVLLKLTDKRGHFIVRGRARKQLKRRYNQYRRGVRRF